MASLGGALEHDGSLLAGLPPPELRVETLLGLRPLAHPDKIDDNDAPLVGEMLLGQGCKTISFGRNRRGVAIILPAAHNRKDCCPRR